MCLRVLGHYPTYLQQSNTLNHESQGCDLSQQQQLQPLAACSPLVSAASPRAWQVWPVWAGLWSRLAPACEGRWPSWPPSWWAGRWLSWSDIWIVSFGVWLLYCLACGGQTGLTRLGGMPECRLCPEGYLTTALSENRIEKYIQCYSNWIISTILFGSNRIISIIYATNLWDSRSCRW